MDKTEFTNELKELSKNMTPDQIERAIMALSQCRGEIYDKTSKEKSDLSKYLATTDMNEADLIFINENTNKSGKIKVLGASLLSRWDYNLLRNESKQRPFWLYEKLIFKEGEINYWPRDNDGAYVRPILIILNSNKAGLLKGCVFSINDEEFKMLSDCIAIRVECLPDRCTFYQATCYANSTIKYTVDGWYAQLIEENSLRADDAS